MEAARLSWFLPLLSLLFLGRSARPGHGRSEGHDGGQPGPRQGVVLAVVTASRRNKYIDSFFIMAIYIYICVNNFCTYHLQ